MNRHPVALYAALVGLAVFSARIAFTQIASSTPLAVESATTIPASVAYVYVQTTNGVNAYDAAANGALTLVKGSPFATLGQMGGNNGKYLISVGNTWLHSYAIGGNGAIGKQAGAINTQNYGGSECGVTSNGSPNGAILDHTGQDFYISLWSNQGTPPYIYYTCAAWQSYRIGSNGEFAFLGDMKYFSQDAGQPDPSTVPTFSSNDKFAYGVFNTDLGVPAYFSTFQRLASGALVVMQSFTETDPESQEGVSMQYYPQALSADNAGHLAALVQSEVVPIVGSQFGPLQLASYTINSSGGISSTNTFAEMPIPTLEYPSIMSMSPSGKLLVLGSVGNSAGIQIFHFNGAAPITAYSAPLLQGVDIEQLAWDKNNHLYALSYDTGMLYVYTVTPTSINEVPGSPFVAPNAYGIQGLIVVPKL